MPKFTNYTMLFDALPAELSLTDTAIFGYIHRMTLRSSHACTAAQETIAQAVRVSSLRTVQKSLDRLETLGLIQDRTPERRNVPHVYVLTDIAYQIISGKNDGTQLGAQDGMQSGMQDGAQNMRMKNSKETKIVKKDKTEKEQEIASSVPTDKERPSGGNSTTPIQHSPPPQQHFTGLIDKVCQAISAQDDGTRTPNIEAVKEAIATWAKRVDESHKDGKYWSYGNVEAIVEHYDAITLQQQYPDVEIPPGL